MSGSESLPIMVGIRRHYKWLKQKENPKGMPVSYQVLEDTISDWNTEK